MANLHETTYTGIGSDRLAPAPVDGPSLDAEAPGSEREPHPAHSWTGDNE